MNNVKTVKKHEPLFHIVKRNALPWWKAWIIRAIAILAAVVVCSVVTILLTKQNPVMVWVAMFKGAFGTDRIIWRLFRDVALLLCVALAVTPAFKMRFWNCGAEGQVLMGCLATFATVRFLGGMVPEVVLLLISLAAALIVGAVWGLIPAVFFAFFKTNETLFTLMMNYVAKGLITLSIIALQWENTFGSQIVSPLKMGRLPKVYNDHLVIILVVAALTAVMYVYLNYTKQGYEISVVGESENTANYIGINVKKVVIRTMLISGAICGLAGFLLVSGKDGTVSPDTADGRGFTAIMVSWLAKFNPVYMIITSLLLVFFEFGSKEITQTFRLNDDFSEILTGIVIFFIIGSEFFINYQLKTRKHSKEVK